MKLHFATFNFLLLLCVGVQASDEFAHDKAPMRFVDMIVTTKDFTRLCEFIEKLLDLQKLSTDEDQARKYMEVIKYAKEKTEENFLEKRCRLAELFEKTLKNQSLTTTSTISFENFQVIDVKKRFTRFAIGSVACGIIVVLGLLCCLSHFTRRSITQALEQGSQNRTKEQQLEKVKRKPYFFF